jgi:putative photosynthetic complex assembly protein
MSEMSARANVEQMGAPRGLLLGAFALVLFTIMATGLGRWTDLGALHMPDATVVDRVWLRFDDLDDGGVAVRNAANDQVIYKVEPGTNGFIRATLRGLARERMRAGVGAQTPFTLTRWNNGSISLHDETSGRRVDLDAFGPTNAQAFAQFFSTQEPLK